MPVLIFERTEQKYRIPVDLRERILEQAAPHLREDEYGASQICNVYYDTPDYRMIRQSIEGPIYKEKLRIRSYNVPDADSVVFVELKKKFNGTVYKRRISMTLREAEDMLSGRTVRTETQIDREISYLLRLYPDLCPSIFLAYDRTAYFDMDNPDFRISFDTDVRFRCDHLSLGYGDRDTSALLPPSDCIMELKGNHAMPLWMARILDQLSLTPVTYSKYGTVYRDYLFPKGAHSHA